MFNDLINIDLFLKNTTNIIYQTLEKSNKKNRRAIKRRQLPICQSKKSTKNSNFYKRNGRNKSNCSEIKSVKKEKIKVKKCVTDFKICYAIKI